MKNLFLLSMMICFSSVIGQSKIPSAESQIKTALYACPEMHQEGAKVLGYNQKGELVTLREGHNGMICLASDPNREGISVSCYSDKLEAYMARGRELIAEGQTEVEKRDTRKQEIDAGTLMMPKEPAAAYMVTAKKEDHDIESGVLKNSKIRYVLYKPYMTGAETGLPTKPGAPGMPWLMDANTHRSHIMITPATDN
ncbi:hypothetical protein LX77_01614 [Gelidibacter algens]|uniref:Uncharacterized protein n=1 Tax=Gelidibacter algens TaxID=49280 RepID=A0A1A7R0W6_9FLAO|nr:hypothetical protein [Gelidibacter algens]OBX25895.1 hypothetical protein A9996_07155 [Gelidibacter algens]RAJ25311.1 hypothetical protein LX77_01614 [Gelidibacter algens]